MGELYAEEKSMTLFNEILSLVWVVSLVVYGSILFGLSIVMSLRREPVHHHGYGRGMA